MHHHLFQFFPIPVLPVLSVLITFNTYVVASTPEVLQLFSLYDYIATKSKPLTEKVILVQVLLFEPETLHSFIFCKYLAHCECSQKQGTALYTR